MSDLTHFNAKGEAHMVDIGDKSITERIATAKGRVVMAKDTLTHLRSGQTKKGDVLGVARLAGIMGAKQCANLIPLCHPLPLSAISVDFELDENAVEITATAKTTGQTGVEMEALTAVNIAALTIYDMLKSVDKTMQITDIRLILKDGGKSGRFEAP